MILSRCRPECSRREIARDNERRLNARDCFPRGIFHEERSQATFGWRRRDDGERCSERAPARGRNKFHFAGRARTSARGCESRFTIHRFIHMEQQGTTPASATDNFATIRRLYRALSFTGTHGIRRV